MTKRRVFYSFHFDNDVMRVQQIRQIGVIEGNEPVSKNEWETARKTPGRIEKWIDENMKYCSCIVVLVGSETASRPWVDYEIRKGWDSGKGVVGIYIHNIKCPRNGRCIQGENPFRKISLKNGKLLSDYVSCYDPNSYDAYNDIANNIETWIEKAISIRNS